MLLADVPGLAAEEVEAGAAGAEDEGAGEDGVEQPARKAKTGQHLIPEIKTSKDKRLR